VALLPAVVTDDVETAKATAAAQHGFYDHIPSYRRVIEASGVDKALDLVTVGSEEAVAAEVRRYVDAGADAVVVTATRTAGAADQARTWRLLGELARQ
jgi:alkanesulfonate monooxygenase SsuD/methylene tetrahydromethanopterin reductase-like flavin-dependent oxidoreductase (luciferase family)